jgi:molybdate transport system substrate-binding protein
VILRLMTSSLRAIVPLVLALSSWSAGAAVATTAGTETRIAVASNFAATLAAIASAFEQGTGQRVTLIAGSTGKHYAQIRNGAPFDAFFAADARHPELLEQHGLAVRGSRFTYAVGRVALWSPRDGYVDADGRVLQTQTFDHLAIANPKLAPYGLAAQQALEARGLWRKVQPKLVRGEDIGQTYQFVASGNAELGFVALSQVRRPGVAPPGSLWVVPQALYQALEQQALLLRDRPVARALLTFARGEPAREIIRAHGYDTP